MRLKFIIAAAVLFAASFGTVSAFDIEKGRVAAFQAQKGEKASAEFDKRLSAAEFDLSAKGSKYAKWTLKRIVLKSSEGLAGTVWFHNTRKDIMLVSAPEKTGTVTLDIIGDGKFGQKERKFFATVYPAALKAGEVEVEYYFADPKGNVEVAGHKVPVSGTFFSVGDVTVIRDVLPGKNPQASGWTVKPYKTDVDAIRARVLEIARKAGIASIQLAYQDNLDKVELTVTNDAWFQKNENRRKYAAEYTNDNVYQAAAVGALPLVYVLLKMSEDGAIDLDKPLFQYDPKFLSHFAKKSHRKARKLTARMCLEHISDISRKEEITVGMPSIKYGESKNNYSVLQWAVEAITGKTAEELCQNAIFAPLKMKSTSYKWQDAYTSLAVPGLGGKEVTNKPDWKERSTDVATCLRTTAPEFGAFLRWVLDGGGLKESTVKYVFGHHVGVAATEYRRERGNLFRGLGWLVEDNPQFGNVATHFGHNGKWRSFAMVIPERSTSFCLFINSSCRVNFYDAMMDLFLQPAEPMASFGCGVLYPLENRK